MKLRVRTPLRALVLGGTCAFMVAGAASTGLAAEHRSSSRNDHALQRPARADRLQARGRLHEAHRHQGQGALGRRGDAGQPDHPGRLEVAGRRLLRREPAGPAGARRRRACSPPWLRPRWPRCRARAARRRGTGSRSRRVQRCSTTTRTSSRRPTCPKSLHGPRLARPGRVASRSLPARPTSSR